MNKNGWRESGQKLINRRRYTLRCNEKGCDGKTRGDLSAGVSDGHYYNEGEALIAGRRHSAATGHEVILTEWVKD